MTEDERRMTPGLRGGLLRGFLGRSQHGAPTAGVDGQHLHIQSHGGGHGFGHGVRDIVILEIEKHTRAQSARDGRCPDRRR